MKKYIAILSIAIFMSCSWHRGKVVTGLEGRPLPEFNLSLSDSITPFSTKNISGGKPFLIFYYQPWCGFCQAQTADIVKHINEMGDLSIYMISSSSHREIREFIKKFKLDQYARVKVLEDPNSQINGYFQPQGVPFLAFYDAAKRLKEARSGKQDIGVLIDYAGN